MKTSPQLPFKRLLENAAADSTLFVGRIRAAAIVDVNPQTLDKLIRQGRLKAYRIGRRVILRRDDLLRFVEDNEI
jgi:excisionase family DNA binding protein